MLFSPTQNLTSLRLSAHINSNTLTMDERYKYTAMTSVENESIKDKYTPDTFFDEWTPCITSSWSNVYDTQKKTLRLEWAHLDKPAGELFVFPIPEKIIHGCLFLDNGQAYFRDYHKGRLSKLRIRYKWSGHNIHILGAFWSPYQQKLIVHDMFMYDGNSLCEKSFKDRWASMKKFIELDYEQDKYMQGFQLNIASVDDFPKKGDTYGVLYQPNIGLATIIHSIPMTTAVQSAPVAVAVSVPVTNIKVVHTPAPTQTLSSTTTLKSKELAKFDLRKHKKFSGPEAFQLWNAEEDLGMPSIQSLSLTKAIREKLLQAETISVSAKWNKDLSSYEVLALA